MIGRREPQGATRSGGALIAGYDTGAFFDEVFTTDANGDVQPREHYRALIAQLQLLDAGALRRASDVANRSFLHQGITFTVYSDAAQGTERIFPFDLIPRLIPASEWQIV